MPSAADIRNEYLDTLDHIEQAFTKIAANLGRGGIFTFPDVHKLTEGLFLSAWTYWEAFLRDLLTYDVAFSAGSLVRRDARGFLSPAAAQRMAERVLNHPDAPKYFADWSDYTVVADRADQLLRTGHRFQALPQNGDIVMMKRVRNAIAHKSDRAWNSFMALVSDPPFNVAPRARRGITPGRFLYSHMWANRRVMENSLIVLRSAARALVP